MATSIKRKFTSSSEKLLAHWDQLSSYAAGGGDTVVHTHVSPTSNCNLSCSYCVYKGRKRNINIDYDALLAYTQELIWRGLKAVTITGGGEPLLYPHINEYVEWCYQHELSVGLITNGFECRSFKMWDKLAWCRVSLNDAPGWMTAIEIPNMPGVLGASVVYDKHTVEDIQKILFVANHNNMEYVRIFPDYTLSPRMRMHAYRQLDALLDRFSDTKIMVLRTLQRAPQCDTCHLTYFRPYLSENGKVYQCCVSIMAGKNKRLPNEHALCDSSDIGLFLDRQIDSQVVPSRDCAHCTYADSVEAIDKFLNGSPDVHDNFI